MIFFLDSTAHGTADDDAVLYVDQGDGGPLLRVAPGQALSDSYRFRLPETAAELMTADEAKAEIVSRIAGELRDVPMSRTARAQVDAVLARHGK